jgi:hypothetical protein
MAWAMVPSRVKIVSFSGTWDSDRADGVHTIQRAEPEGERIA